MFHASLKEYCLNQRGPGAGLLRASDTEKMKDSASVTCCENNNRINTYFMIYRQSVDNNFSTYIVSRVDMIEMIIWINIAERHRRAAIPRHIDCMRPRCSIVENFEFITM